MNPYYRKVWFKGWSKSVISLKSLSYTLISSLVTTTFVFVVRSALGEKLKTVDFGWCDIFMRHNFAVTLIAVFAYMMAVNAIVNAIGTWLIARRADRDLTSVLNSYTRK